MLTAQTGNFFLIFRRRAGILFLICSITQIAGLHFPQVAFAAPSVSLPSTFVATTSFTNVNANGSLSISGYNVGATVQATVSVNSGNIKIATTSGLTAPTGYTSAAWTADNSSSIAFYGTESSVSAALNSLQYKASSVGSNATISVATFVAGAAYDGTTGHFYEIVTSSSNITWELARCKALYSNSDVSASAGASLLSNDRCTSSTTLVRRTQGGLRGYLANITSASEQTFIKGKLSSVGWIGGADTDVEGSFVWMDGPEKGQVFWNSSATLRRDTNTVTGSVSSFSYGSGRFNYFSDGEPNDAGGAEDFVEFGYGSQGSIGASWNDCQNNCNRKNFVIEYGETGDSLSGASGTIAVTTKPILSASPSISGTTRYGSIVTSSTGSWGNSPTAYTYQWSSSSTSGGTYSSISGATSSSFTLTGSEVGKYLKVAVTATNTSGSTTDTSTASSVITAAPLTISAINSTKTYSGATATGVATYSITSGLLIGSDTFTALTYTWSSASPSYSSTTPPTNAGIYTVTPSAATFMVGNASNYSITYLPATLTISKAETITVTMDTITAVTYTGSPAVLNTKINISGLMGSDSATADLNYRGNVIRYTIRETGISCADGGTCVVGDSAPGGGYVFYVSPTAIESATGVSEGGIYLATAPNDWISAAGLGSYDPKFGCSGATLSGNFIDSIGAGAANTLALSGFSCVGVNGATTVSEATINGYSDWFVPTLEELKLVRTNLFETGIQARYQTTAGYWSSLPDLTGIYNAYVLNSNGNSASIGRGSGVNQFTYIMPVRAFNPIENVASAVPTNAGNYLALPVNFNFISPASISNYQAISVTGKSFTINKSRQTALSIGQYMAFVGTSTYPINVYGGSGTGTLSRSLTSSGTANCTLQSGMFVQASAVGSCSVTAVKLRDSNYLT